MQPVPERESARDDESDENANQEKQAIHRQSDEENRDNSDRSEKRGRTLQAETETRPGHLS